MPEYSTQYVYVSGMQINPERPSYRVALLNEGVSQTQKAIVHVSRIDCAVFHQFHYLGRGILIPA